MRNTFANFWESRDKREIKLAIDDKESEELYFCHIQERALHEVSSSCGALSFLFQSVAKCVEKNKTFFCRFLDEN
jgi:hypothetical protein